MYRGKLVGDQYKYFFYYSGNPKAGGGKQIGVAISDSPAGPFVDLGHPIITDSPTGHGQQIDVTCSPIRLRGSHICIGETVIWQVQSLMMI